MGDAQLIVLIHIGPVQDFIASARRCRDLWFGSQLLSDCANDAANAILDAADASAEQSLIFPGLLPEQGEDGAVSNKLQFVFPASLKPQLGDIMDAGYQSMMSYLNERASVVFERCLERLPRPNMLDSVLAKQHIAHMMEYVWIVVDAGASLTDDDALYVRTRQRAEALLAAAKRSKTWPQVSWDDAGLPKSSLDGFRPTVFSHGVHQELTDLQLYDIFRIKRGEHLCGVGLLKRLGLRQESETPHFHSTSHMASAPTRAALAQRDEGQQAIQTLIRSYERHHVVLDAFRIGAPTQHDYTYTNPCQVDAQPLHLPATMSVTDARGESICVDGELLYPNRLDTPGHSAILSRGSTLDGMQRQMAEQDINGAQRDVMSLASTSEPFAYYAMLLADGDKMGQAINRLGSLDAHRTFSRVLEAQFAQQCHGLVASHGGSLIYAGGDDVLALLPMHTVLQCARALRDLFAQTMSQAMPSLIPHPTLSVGIAIAHHLEPLGHVRLLAKKAEVMAKEEGRNRLAIAMQKRSNAARFVCGPWDDEAQQPIDHRLMLWAQLKAQRVLPNRLAQRLLDLVEPLTLNMPSSHRTPADLVEVCRALVHQATSMREQQLGTNTRTQINTLYEHALARCHGDALLAVRAMSEELHLAEEFYRAWQATTSSEVH